MTFVLVSRDFIPERTPSPPSFSVCFTLELSSGVSSLFPVKYGAVFKKKKKTVHPTIKFTYRLTIEILLWSGVVLAEESRFWEAIKKWESALSLGEFGRVQSLRLATVANGGDEEKGKDDKLAQKSAVEAAFVPSEDSLLDAQLLEMKAQVECWKLASVFSRSRYNGLF